MRLPGRLPREIQRPVTLLVRDRATGSRVACGFLSLAATTFHREVAADAHEAQRASQACDEDQRHQAISARRKAVSINMGTVMNTVKM